MHSVDDHTLVTALERRLAAALGGSTRFGRLGLHWPAAAARRAADTVAFRTNDVGGYGPIPLDRTLDTATVTTRFAKIPEFARTDELRQSRLIPCADRELEELLTPPIPMDHWVTFETTIADRTYRLHEGRWHDVGQAIPTNTALSEPKSGCKVIWSSPACAPTAKAMS
ncbi:TIGR04141 family sporadically distributed protein [Saccharothrix sp. 6-C]|uniref:TIGR04141 family sporadically distributed protein n=1 Tax=Saccharothrix sp. 6-C TaxID=2781735 RepID=UPI0019177271|nr:TIGR04141 family sporadically distributed protein [Saccharothrix sp. 6-C]QQQ77803.1 TIGR04141 family sporadically distributed protein [Saccharothrix sp. 6-C]